MAKEVKKAHYHIGANNKVSQCRAKKRDCPYATYESYGAAVTAKSLMDETAKGDASYAVRADKLTRAPKDYVGVLSYDMDEPSNYGRTLAQRMDYLESTGKPRFEFVNAYLSADIGDTKFIMRRTLEPHDNSRKIYSSYEVECQDSRGIVTSRDTMYVASESDARNVKRKLFSVITQATNEAYPNDPDTARRKRDEYLDTAMNAIKTAETETHGVLEADRWGVSFFNGSTTDTLVATADLSQTTFRGSMIRDALGGDAYVFSNPKMNITIQDSRPRHTSAYWNAIYQNNDWFVQTVDHEGNAFNHGPYHSADDVSQAVGYFSQQGMGMKDHEVQTSMDAIHGIVNDIAKYREEHALDVERNLIQKRNQQSNQQREQSQRIAAEHASTMKSDGVFSKFMNLFQ